MGYLTEAVDAVGASAAVVGIVVRLKGEAGMSRVCAGLAGRPHQSCRACGCAVQYSEQDVTPSRAL